MSRVISYSSFSPTFIQIEWTCFKGWQAPTLVWGYTILIYKSLCFSLNWPEDHPGIVEVVAVGRINYSSTRSIHFRDSDMVHTPLCVNLHPTFPWTIVKSKLPHFIPRWWVVVTELRHYRTQRVVANAYAQRWFNSGFVRCSSWQTQTIDEVLPTWWTYQLRLLLPQRSHPCRFRQKRYDSQMSRSSFSLFKYERQRVAINLSVV